MSKKQLIKKKKYFHSLDRRKLPGSFRAFFYAPAVMGQAQKGLLYLGPIRREKSRLYCLRDNTNKLFYSGLDLEWS
jgi:hypothetical protein